MPNVAGLIPATEITTKPGQYPYGNNARVIVQQDGSKLLVNHAGDTIASVIGGVASVDLGRMDPVVTASVNVFLRPFGKVKPYWRTGEYRWHSNTAPVVKPASAPKVTPEVTPNTPSESVGTTLTPPKAEVRATPHPATAPSVIGSEIVSDKPAKVKSVGKHFTAIGEVIAPNEDYQTLETAWTIRQTGRPAAVIVTGPAGTAKTRLIEQYAASKGVGVVKVDAGTIQMASDWFGQMVQDAAGNWQWEWSDLALAVQRGTPCIILIDEINRTESARAQAGIFGLLDWTRQVKPVGAPEPLRLGAGIMFAATLNEGPEYVGTVEVDAALRDRFAWGVRMAYTPEAVEARILRQAAPGLDSETAKRLVRIAATQRAKRYDDTLYPSGNIISTRVLIDVACAITLVGREPVDAIWSALRGRFWIEDEPALRVAIEAQYGATPEDVSLLDDLDSEDMEHLLSALDA